MIPRSFAELECLPDSIRNRVMGPVFDAAVRIFREFVADARARNFSHIPYTLIPRICRAVELEDQPQSDARDKELFGLLTNFAAIAMSLPLLEVDPLTLEAPPIDGIDLTAVANMLNMYAGKVAAGKFSEVPQDLLYIVCRYLEHLCNGKNIAGAECYLVAKHFATSAREKNML